MSVTGIVRLVKSASRGRSFCRRTLQERRTAKSISENVVVDLSDRDAISVSRLMGSLDLSSYYQSIVSTTLLDAVGKAIPELEGEAREEMFSNLEQDFVRDIAELAVRLDVRGTVVNLVERHFILRGHLCGELALVDVRSERGAEACARPSNVLRRETNRGNRL